jgi:hypothetical protein
LKGEDKPAHPNHHYLKNAEEFRSIHHGQGFSDRFNWPTGE